MTRLLARRTPTSGPSDRFWMSTQPGSQPRVGVWLDVHSYVRMDTHSNAYVHCFDPGEGTRLVHMF